MKEFWETGDAFSRFSKSDAFGFESGEKRVEWRCPVCYRLRKVASPEDPCFCGTQMYPIPLERKYAESMRPQGERVANLLRTDPMLQIEEAWTLLQGETEPKTYYAHAFRDGGDYEHRR